MVSQRQRLAKRKFKQENPRLFPKQDPVPPSDSAGKKKKKKSNFKRKKSDATDPKTLANKSSSYKRHPLRVPGLKPGDGCFICRGKTHVAKNCPEKALWEKNKICLLCRQRGHTLKRCPNKSDENLDSKMCYNCGESGHSLSECLQPLEDGGTKFASCFICKEQGHLSKNCPKSTHGVYPKGGCCKVCGGVTHLAKDCPEKGLRVSSGQKRDGYFDAAAPRGKVTNLVSGDDLEDDFMIDDHQAGDKKKPDKSDIKENDVQVKPKPKQGSKVVNFVG
ncbi:hypothetical protein V2J09_011212 [Rumex salicifolius]